MKRISAYFIDLLIIVSPGVMYAQDTVQPQDSVTIPLKIMAGIDIAGPIIYSANKNVLNAEGFIGIDLDEKKGIFFGAGYSNYKYNQYNYDYLSKGFFLRSGISFNLLKPEVAVGKYWAGVGLNYGLSVFTCETTTFSYENYWGIVYSSIPSKRYLSHYLEISPGFRAEIFRNFTMGWSLNLRKLLFSGTGRDLRPIYFAGYGTGSNPFSAGINYYLAWNIPFNKIRVEIKKELSEESEEIMPTTSNPDTNR